MSLQFFNRKLPYQIHNGDLPHIDQIGSVQMVTYRLADSLPAECLVEINTFKCKFLERYPKPWNDDTQRLYRRHGYDKLEQMVDRGYGECLLRRVDCRKIVEDSIFYLAERDFRLHAYVVMPNHVHLLITPNRNLDEILHSHKSFTSHEINKLLGRRGKLWQKESYDRMIRNEYAFWRAVRYIYENPRYLPSTDYSLGFAKGIDPLAPEWEEE